MQSGRLLQNIPQLATPLPYSETWIVHRAEQLYGYDLGSLALRWRVGCLSLLYKWLSCTRVLSTFLLLAIPVRLIGNFDNAGAPNFAWGAIFVTSNLFRAYFNVKTNAGARI